MYERFRMPLDGQWPPVQAEQFVPLLLATKDLCQPDTDSEVRKRVDQTLAGDVESMSKRSTELELAQLFEPDERGRAVNSILVEGAPGIGKTAFCLTVCKQWSAGKLFHNDYHTVVLWSLKDPAVAKFASVDELFFHDSEEIRKAVIESVKRDGGKGVLFVLDGWDELPQSLARDKHFFLLDLVRGKVLPFSSIIVTSRPLQSQKLLQARYFHRSVEILGFSKASISEYIQRCFHASPDIAKLLQRQLIERPDIESICYLPMNCAIVSYVFSRKKELPSTLTKFYSYLALNSLVRNIQLRREPQNDSKIEDITELTNLDSLPPEVSSLFLALCELAFRGLWVNQHTYSRDEIAAVCQSSPGIIVDLDSLGILQTVNIFHFSGFRPAFHFLHSTLQEFMAARYLASLEIVRQNYYIEKYFSYAAFYTVWQFYCGIASEANILLKTTIVEKMQQEVSEITSFDAELHDCFSECSSEDEYSFEEEEEVEEEEEEEILEENEENGEEEVAKIPDAAAQEELTFAMSPPSTSISLTPSTQITAHQKPVFEGPSTFFSAEDQTQEYEDIPFSGDRIGSKQQANLGKLSGVSLTIDQCTAKLAFKISPTAAYRHDRRQLLRILRCIYESQRRSMCSQIGEKCHECLFFKDDILPPVDMNALGFFIAKSGKRWQLQFHGCSLGLTDLVILRHQLLQRHATGKLRRLYIYNNSFDAPCISELCSMAPALLPCEKLVLGDDQLGDRGVGKTGITQLLPQLRSIRAVGLPSNALHDNGVIELCASLHACQLLTHIDLSSNSLSHEGVQAITSTLHRIVFVNMGSNHLGDEGAALFSAMLASSKHLKHLDLSNNSIGCEGTAHLASALTANTSLNNLILDSNPIGSEGADIILDMLTINRTLQSLNLANCEIEGNDALIAKFLTTFPSASKVFKQLEVSYNSLGDEGISALIQALGSDTSLTTLGLAVNDINTLALQQLGAFLCQNSTLSKLSIAGYELTSDEDALVDFCSCLLISEKLKVLEIPEVDEDKEELKRTMDAVNVARQQNQKHKLKIKLID